MVRSIAGYFAGGIVLLAMIIVGFIFSIRGCLSAYDQRYALPNPLYFKKGDKEILFSLVKYQETTSYEQEGAITTKNFSNSYLVQNNDAVNGIKLSSRKILDENVHQFPEEILGASGTCAWIFLDELIAFDAFSLEKSADTNAIVKANPALKNKMPAERQYYYFDPKTADIIVTAKDASMWQLDTKTLTAKSIEKAETVKNVLSSGERARSLQQVVFSFNQQTINQDTAGGSWCGIYSATEWTKLDNKFTCSPTYDQNERRQVLKGRYNTIGNNCLIDKGSVQLTLPGTYFLDGGMLADRQTGLPIKMVNNLIIVSKSQVGAAGSIVISMVRDDGTVAWQTDSGLSNWADWKYTGGRIIIVGTSNSNLSTGQFNLFSVIDLAAGKLSRYDFYTDKSIQ